MANLSLIVNNQELDFIDDKDFPIVFNRNVSDLNDISARGGDITYTLKIPSTPKNLQILGLSLEKEVPNKFYSDQKINIDCYVNTNKIFSGYFVITNYNKKDIQGNLRSYSISQGKDLSKKNLTDLNFDEVDFYGMETIISNTNLYNFTEPGIFTEPFIFPLISRGVYADQQRPVNYSKFINTKYINMTDQSFYLNDITSYNGTVEAVFNITPKTVPHLNFEDIPPSFFLVNILKRIFKDIGYSVSGSQIKDPSINCLIIPAMTSNTNRLNYNQNLLSRLLCYNKFGTSLNYIYFSASPTANAYDQTTFRLPNMALPNTGYYSFTNALKQNKYADIITPGSNYMIHDYNYGICYNEDSGIYSVPIDGQYEIDLSIVYKTSFTDQKALQASSQNSQVYQTGDLSYNKQNQIPYLALIRFNDSDNIDFVEDFTKTVNGTTLEYDPKFIKDRIVRDINNNPVYIRLNEETYTAESLNNYIVDLKNGDRFKLVVFNYSTYGYIIGAPGGFFCSSVEFTSLRFDIKCISSTDKFRIQDNLPNISQANFLKDIIKMFNLYFMVDEINKFIIFEKYDNFYLNSPLNLKEIPDYNLSPAQNNYKYEFKYSVDSNDVLIPKNYVEYNFELINNINNYLDISSTEVSFSPTKFQEYKFIVSTKDTTKTPQNAYQDDFRTPTHNLLSNIYNGTSSIFIPQISPEETYNSTQQTTIQDNINNVGEDAENIKGQGFNNNNIRILKLSDVDNTVNFIPVRRFKQLGLGNTGSTDIIDALPKFISCKFIEDSPLQLNKEVDSLDQETLYEKNYFNYISLLQSSEILEIDVLLNDDNYNNLQPNRLVKIDQNIYSLISLSGYKPIGIVPTKMKLLKIR